MKEMGSVAPDPGSEGPIPASFNWKNTHDATIAVAAPTVDGTSAEANIRIYSSPILSTNNLVAKGVATANGQFQTAVTVPAAVTDLYVKTTLPDGRLSVQSVPVAASINVPGAVIKQGQKSSVSMKAITRVSSGFDALDIPTLALMTPEAFDPQAVISQIEPGKNYKLGDKTPYYVAENYLIPSGAVITSGIDLSGDLKTTRTLYIAGKLQLESLSIGNVTLAVLPGGEVRTSSLTTNHVNNTLGIYVFEDGKFAVGSANLTHKVIVNKGTFEADDLNANNNTEIYNFTGATMTMDDVEITNHAVLHNDGTVKIADAEGNSNAKFYNYENGSFDFAEFYSANGSVEIWQRGAAHFGDFSMSGGKFYFQCYTTMGELSGDNGEIVIASGTGLDVKEIDFNWGVKVSLGNASILTVENFETDGANFTSEVKKNTDETPAVILITKTAVCDIWGGTSFKGGPMEVVYSESLDKKLFSNGSGAYQSATQQTVLTPTVCNGGKSPVVPDPDPLPEEEYSFDLGARATYAFEDNWPWFGDYDMNDVVVLSSIDREVSKDGSKVISIRINWELKAAGSTYRNAFGLRLDKVLASQVASVESTFTNFGSGAFAAQGLETGHEYAVIALFNDAKNILKGSNTTKGMSVPTTKYTTTVKFTQPVSPSDVIESAMNFFIVAKERSAEIHVPTYSPSVFADVESKGNYLSSDPYKYFKKGDVNNHMMWALSIPGDFRYPAETKDIRKAYTNFMKWASSGGVDHKEWYNEEINEEMIY